MFGQNADVPASSTSSCVPLPLPSVSPLHQHHQPQPPPPPSPPPPTPPCFILSISLQNFLSHVLNPFQPQRGSSLLRSPLPFAFGLTLRTDALPRSAGEAGVTLQLSSMPLSPGDKTPFEDTKWVREEEAYTLHHWQHPVGGGGGRSQIRPPCYLFAAVSLSGNSYPSCAGRANCLLSDT